MDKPSRSEHARLWGLEEGRIFLNHGSFGATPTAVREEQRTWQDLMENEPVRFFEDLMPGILEQTTPDGAYAGENPAVVLPAVGLNMTLLTMLGAALPARRKLE